MKVVEIISTDGAVSVQWIAPSVGIVRYHSVGGFGAPFEFSLTMVRLGVEAIFYAAGSTYTRAIHRAMRTAMWTLGIQRVRYERRGLSVRPKVLVR